MRSQRLTKSELRREIEKEESIYKAEELFSDGSLSEILESIVVGTCQKMGEYPTLSLMCNKEKDVTAYTDGYRVFQNTLGPLIRDLPTNWEKYMANVGHTVHEVGHILFTDFPTSKLCFKFWDEGKFFSEHSEEEIKQVEEHFKGVPEARKLYSKIMRNITNTLEDAFIENCLRVLFSGVAVQGLSLVNKEVYRKMGTMKNVIEKVTIEGLPPIIILDAILLSRYVCKRDLELGNLNEAEKKLLYFVEGVLIEADKEIEELLWEQSGQKRFKLLEKLYIKFLPLFPTGMLNMANSPGFSGQSSENGEKTDNPDNKEGSKQGGKTQGESNGNASSSQGEGNQQGMSNESQSENKSENTGDVSNSKGVSGESKGESNSCGSSEGKKDITPEEAEKIASKINDINKATGKSKDSTEKAQRVTTPKGKLKITEEDKKKAEEKEKLASNAGEVNGNLALQKAIKQAVEGKVFNADEYQHTKDLTNEIVEMFNNKKVGNETFAGYLMNRPPVGSINEYNAIFTNVSKSSQNLIRKLNNILREREVESVSSGFMMGQRFNAKDIVNQDGKYFSRQIVPDGKITTAFAVLIDQSGSMKHGYDNIPNIQRAREAAVLFEYVLRKLNIPHMIAGHNTERQQGICSNITVFADFDTRDNKDYLRLTSIDAHGGNIDGAAITYVGEKLLKRPEKKKVLIVISDGLPAGNSFYSRDSNEDTKLAINHYRKKGIEVFGAIVDNSQKVMSLYGDNYGFDCTTDGELEKQFIRLIKKYVLMK